MKFEPAKLWKPGDDIWDLCDEYRFHQNMSMKGIFTPELLCLRTGEVSRRGIAPNAILDSAITEIFWGANPRLSYSIMVVGDNGTDTDPLVDTGVKHVVNGGVAAGGPTACYTMPSVDVGNYGWSYTAYWASQYGNGDIAEVGMMGTNNGWFNVGYLNRAVIVDDRGNKITIPKDTGHVMRITAQFDFKFNRVT